jgi:hypothetical protein
VEVPIRSTAVVATAVAIAALVARPVPQRRTAFAVVVVNEATTTTLDSTRRARPRWGSSGVAIIAAIVTAPDAAATHAAARSREQGRGLVGELFTRTG